MLSMMERVPPASYQSLIHWSAAPLGALTPTDPGLSPRLDKPHGLWFSAGDGEDGWRAWCEAEGFAMDRLSVSTEIVLGPRARVFLVSDATGLRALGDRYRRQHAAAVPGSLQCQASGPDWRRIGMEYDAVVIAPYIWECRLEEDTSWYYSWDCASGCVWNTDVVETREYAPARPVDYSNARPLAQLVGGKI